MVKLSDPNYFTQSALLRATQAWRIEGKAEREISTVFQSLSEQIRREIADMYALYSVDGVLDYQRVLRRLTPFELSQYRNTIQSLINQNTNLDEETLLELRKLLSYTNLTILTSKMLILEGYTAVAIAQSSEISLESLSDTYKYIYDHTLYDIHRKIGYVTPFEKANDEMMLLIIMQGFQGEDSKAAMKQSRNRINGEMKRLLNLGIKGNQPYPKLSKMMTDLVSGGKGFNSIRNILRGDTATTIAETSAESYRQAGLKKYQFVATLDNRTSGICRGLDGAIFNLSDLEVGTNAPKMHFGCRSAIAPFIDMDDLSELERTARSRSGRNYKVPGDITYKQWQQQYY